MIGYRLKIFVSGCAILFLLTTCNQAVHKGTSEETTNNETKSLTKPPSIFSDTLTVTSKAAIFFYPDSLQLKKMRADSDTAKFDAVMHEYEYQFRYVHFVLNKYWPNLKIIEAKKARYLLFIKTDKNTRITDLDTKNDPYGFIVFDPAAEPIQLEMTNAESEIGFYFSPGGPKAK